jgi:multiple sugar transport system substrate-binding protein
MKKVTALLLAILMVATLLPNMALAQGKTVLTVKTWDVNAGSAAYLQATEAAFEAANPDVDLQYVDTASQEYATLVSTSLAAGDTTDVFDVKEVRDLQNWIAQGYVENLESYIAKDSYDLKPFLGMEKYYRGSDKALYALPYRSDFWVLFYNKTLFDKAGVACPTSDMTWDQYAELAKKMTSGEGVDKIYGTHYHTWLSAVANWAVCDGVNTMADGEYSDLKYFYDLALGLAEAGACMEYSELKAAGLHYRNAFEQGNIAMIPMGYCLAGSLIVCHDRNRHIRCSGSRCIARLTGG